MDFDEIEILFYYETDFDLTDPDRKRRKIEHF